MTAVDTNVIVRLLAAEEPRQEATARSLFARETIWIAKTVLLETGWVLRSVYRFDELAIRDAFLKLLGLENVQVEDEPGIAAALELVQHGVELADAIHLSSRPEGVRFVSLDKPFVQRAARAGVSGVCEIR